MSKPTVNPNYHHYHWLDRALIILFNSHIILDKDDFICPRLKYKGLGLDRLIPCLNSQTGSGFEPGQFGSKDYVLCVSL